ncbi:uncharacterized protein BDW43DRAFT_87254 [Aspergillus alliaceus]|uniref:uncharacterized protein n=1 Tax=Petromyces alliaceus TaxID=209559 RepID=UPI0012A513C4|nr:uncharacterized protein BDW43DRAFT_87254 [Aspergillus alliaceus]KAB8233432.1 hypothetical protein BDW43DRAFT_87254 [Aspergillus alliaceus]
MPRVAIVTGSARGIGKAIALRLAANGYSVCINDIIDAKDAITSVVDEINTTISQDGSSVSSRPRAIGIAADVTSSSAVEAMVQETVERLGPLTLMVANAGIAQVKRLLDVTEADIDQVFSVNFKGVFNCYTHAARQMIVQGDPQTAAGVGVYKIVGASSIVGFRAFGALGVYSASKWAVRGLTQAMSIEMAPHKITVNAYAPGVVGTAMWDKIDEELGGIEGRSQGETRRVYSNKAVLGRTSEPEDVAGLVGGFLASQDSDFVTGQTMVVDGGIVFT